MYHVEIKTFVRGLLLSFFFFFGYTIGKREGEKRNQNDSRSDQLH